MKEERQNFDSGLIEAPGESARWKNRKGGERPRCSAFGSEKPGHCPPTVKALGQSAQGAATGGGDSCDPSPLTNTWKGTINPNGEATNYRFVWGANYEHSVSSTKAIEGTAPIEVSLMATVERNSQGTGQNCQPIPFRLEATNGEGTTTPSHAATLTFYTAVG